MAVPNNPAEALARLLRSVTQSGQNNFGSAWASVLGAPITSAEFVRRHSAVVGLVSDIQNFLESLAEDDELRVQHCCASLSMTMTASLGLTTIG